MSLRFLGRASCVVLVALGALDARGAVRYVDVHSVAPLAPYTNEANAAVAIQDAVAFAGVGDTILVKDGTYVLANEIVITKSMNVRSVNGPSVTIVDGNNANRCFGLYNSGVRVEGLTLTRGVSDMGGGAYLLRGGTLTNCWIAGNQSVGPFDSPGHGGGVYCDNGGLVAGCTISNNVSAGAENSGYGGGAYLYGGGTLVGCTIVGNRGGVGGGAYLDEGGVVQGCTVVSNSALYSGGGLQLVGGAVSGSTIQDNKTQLMPSAPGGGLYASGGTIARCTIRRNHAPGGGAGVHLEGGASLSDSLVVLNAVDWSHGVGGGVACGGPALVQSCTIAKNTGGDQGGGFVGPGTVVNSIVYANTAASNANYVADAVATNFSYCCSLPPPVGAGNTGADPLFANPDGDDFHLQPVSPCVDAGVAAGSGTDLDGQVRPLDGNLDGVAAYDMGAYERTAPAGWGGLQVAFLPPAPAAGAAWRADYGTWRTNGESALLWGASHWVDFADVPGWTKPAGRSVTITGGGLSVVNVAYTLSSTLHYVNGASATPAAPYASWATAARTVAAALEYCADGHRVVVTNGVYALGATVALSNAVTVVSVNGAAVTTLDGGSLCGVARLAAAGAVLDGFTLQHGLADRGGGAYVSAGLVCNCTIAGNLARDVSGGGAYLTGGTVSNCAIRANTVQDFYDHATGETSGGGVRLAGGGLLVDCAVTGHQAVNGAGVLVGSGGAVRNCTISGNTAANGGGGLYAVTYDASSAVVERCTIGGNRAGHGAGAELGVGGILRNSVVANNTAAGGGFGAGGGVECAGGTVQNCTLYGNASDNIAGGLYANGGLVQNSIVWGNSAAVGGANFGTGASGATYDHNCSTPMMAGTLNTTNDPLFVNSGAGDYRLLAVSPCVDSGVNNGLASDRDGNARPLDGNGDGTAAYDRGAYETLPGSVGLGYLSVTLSPAGAVAGGAVWRVNGSAWHVSGDTVGLAAGTAAVEFGTVAGWLAPAGQAVAVAAGVFTNVTGVYLPLASGQGYLQVNLGPALAVASGAQWRVDSGAWRASGESVALWAASHYVDYSDVAGWTKPAGGSVTVVEGVATVTGATYQAVVLVTNGSVSVALAPAGALSAGARWRINGVWHDSGAVVSLPPAGYAVDYLDIIGWVKPAAQPVTVSASVQTNLTATYTDANATAATPEHFVNAGSTAPVSPYTNWATAARTIGDAVGVAWDGDTVRVKPGTYTLASEIVVSRGVLIRSESGPAVTTVSGNMSVRCITLYQTNAVLDGFTITAGVGTSLGGAVYCAYGTVRNCVLHHNYCDEGDGGAIYCAQGAVLNCTVRDNWTKLRGGGIFCYAGSTISNCTIRGNGANLAGGGVCAYESTVQDCTICTNSANIFGGGMVNDHGVLQSSRFFSNWAPQQGGGLLNLGGTVRNCLFNGGNSSANYGGAIYSSEGLIENCTLAENWAGLSAGGLYTVGAATVRNSILYHNYCNGTWQNYFREGAGSVFECTCAAPYTFGTGNIANDPLFVNSAGGDQHLAAGSPCVNAGLNEDWMNTGLDLDRRPRIGELTVDMGAFEYRLVPVQFTRTQSLVMAGAGWGDAGLWNCGLGQWEASTTGYGTFALSYPLRYNADNGGGYCGVVINDRMLGRFVEVLWLWDDDVSE